MISNTVNLKQQHSDRFHGTLQALFAVMLFSLTVPFTQLALADFQAAFIASSRALIAGLLAWMIIYKHGWKMPAARVIPWLLLAGSGVVLGFPYFLSLSLTQATAADMGVVLAGLPLTTALMGAWIQHERHGPGFWLAAISGGLLLASYVLLNMGGSADFDSDQLGLLLATLLMGGDRLQRRSQSSKTDQWPGGGLANHLLDAAAVPASIGFLVGEQLGRSGRQHRANRQHLNPGTAVSDSDQSVMGL